MVSKDTLRLLQHHYGHTILRIGIIVPLLSIKVRFSPLFETSLRLAMVICINLKADCISLPAHSM